MHSSHYVSCSGFGFTPRPTILLNIPFGTSSLHRNLDVLKAQLLIAQVLSLSLIHI